MHEIKVTTAKKSFIDRINEINAGNILIKITEEVWPVLKGHITFTAIRSRISEGGADVQAEIIYARSGASPEEKEKLSDAIGAKLKELLPFANSVSVVTRPCDPESTFKVY